MEEASLRSPRNFVGVIFSDSMSYQLRFPPEKVPVSAIHIESRGNLYICMHGSCNKIMYYIPVIEQVILFRTPASMDKEIYESLPNPHAILY